MLDLAASGVADVSTAVLVWSGLAKVREPGAFAEFAGMSRLGRGRGAARLLGGVEIVASVLAVSWGGPVAFGALGAAYLVFAVTTAAAIRAGSPSCGCFGERSAPPTPGHVVLDLVFASSALVAAVNDTPSLVARLDPTLDGVVYLGFVVAAASLAVVTMTSAAELSALRRRRTPSAAGAGSS